VKANKDDNQWLLDRDKKKALELAKKVVISARRKQSRPSTKPSRRSAPACSFPGTVSATKPVGLRSGLRALYAHA